MGPAGAVLVTDTSADVATKMVTVAELLSEFGSNVAAVTLAVFEITVPAGVLGLVRTVRVKLADAPNARVPMVRVSVPVPPTGGDVIVNAGPEVCAT